ncbi:MAG TPA: hypothetical protein VN909_07170 [Candidatus Dormibacteraeota bacterium]|nr:hypothetical protein [Candidatus Dormibacteraeota bacterium]
MSRTLLLRVVAAVLLAGALFCSGRFAAASAASLEDLLAGALAPSAAAALLGPITAAGRVGWECKPERAAAAAGWHEAELPHDAGTQ